MKMVNKSIEERMKGFTLIELLVVVAIIGILAAVGITAFNGFISSSKINATKSQHKTIVKFINISMVKCELSGTSIQLVNFNSQTYNFDCSQNDLGIWRNAFFAHFLGLGWKNPYNTPSPWDVNNNLPYCCMPYNDNPYVWETGITSIGTQGNNIIVYTDIDGVINNRLMDSIRKF